MIRKTEVIKETRKFLFIKKVKQHNGFISEVIVPVRKLHKNKLKRNSNHAKQMELFTFA